MGKLVGEREAWRGRSRDIARGVGGGTAGKSLASPWAREIDEPPGFVQSFHVGADGSNNDKIQDKRDGMFYQSGPL